MADRRVCSCGGRWVHHTNNDDDGCWCQNCLDGPRDKVCMKWDPVEVTKPAVNRSVVRTRHDAPETSHLAAAAEKMRVGSTRYDIYRCILLKTTEGLTDEELEGILGKKHQTVSAARNTLMNDGLIVDSGQRRKTTSGHEAIVWVSYLFDGNS